jgi:Flp pilus assembly protein TadG
MEVRLCDDRVIAEGRIMVRGKRSPSRRRGATALEFAFVLPVFLIFVFGLMAVGHYRMSADLLKGACRNAARYGAMQDVSTAMAQQRFRETVAPGMNANLVTLYIKDMSTADSSNSAMPSSSSQYNALPDIELSNAPSRRLFAVYAEVNYNSIAIIPMNWIPWANNLKLSAQVFTRHE